MKTRLFVRQLKSIGFVDRGACEGADIIAAKSAAEGGSMDMEQVAAALEQLTAQVAAIQTFVAGATKQPEPEMDEPAKAEVEAKAEDEAEETASKADVLDVSKRLEEAEKRAAVAEEIAKAERDKRLTAEWITKTRADLAALPADAETLGCVLKRASEVVSVDDFAELHRVLKAAAEQIAANDALTREVGGTGNETSESSAAKIDSMARALVTEGVAKSYGEAIGILGGRTENRALFESYRNETLRRG